MPLGSRSAQTFHESYQDSHHEGDPVSVGRNLLNDLPYGYYKVYHIWKALNKNAPRILRTHHSQIQVDDMSDTPILNVGLFAEGHCDPITKKFIKTGNALVQVDQIDRKKKVEYEISASYKPNPVRVLSPFIKVAYYFAVNKCGSKYTNLHNNCQKFARYFMQYCGARHIRRLWHL